jgi:hypothetical protein
MQGYFNNLGNNLPFSNHFSHDESMSSTEKQIDIRSPSFSQQTLE